MSQISEGLYTDIDVVVVRSGGVAGIARRWSVTVDPSRDPAWILLIDQCPWTEAPEPPQAASDNDRYVWELTVELGTERRAAELAERDATGPWRELIDAVRSAAKVCPSPSKE